MRHAFVGVLSVILAFAQGCAAQVAPTVPETMLTVAERSEFTATSNYSETVAIMGEIARRSQHVTLASMGVSGEGRDLPVLIISSPPVREAADARARRREGAVVVLVLGSIHGGEIAGKEAMLILAREMALDAEHPLLKNLVLVLCPLYNADGNERMDPGNRPGQVGPEKGMGERANAAGLDLNRDFIKAEASETRALLKFLRDWDPDVVIDTHTTNGSRHRYLVTYDGAKVLAGDRGLYDFVRKEYLPAVQAAIEARGLDDGREMRTFWYGNFNPDHTTWTTYEALGRYVTNGINLRGRIGILSEAYSYASYRDRIFGSKRFLEACLRYAAGNAEKIRAITESADEANEVEIAIRTRLVAAPEKMTVLGYESRADAGEGQPAQPRDYEVDAIIESEAVLTVERPWAYLVPAGMTRVVENLQRHGVPLETLREDIELDVQVYGIDSVSRRERAFQGVHLVTVEATMREESRMIPAGTIVARADGERGNLAVYLLEPQCEDGLTTWGFFDDALEEGGDFPVVRLKSDPTLITGEVRKLPEDRGEKKRITYDVVYGRGGDRPSFGGSPVRGLRWLDDEHYAQRRGGKEMKVHALTGRIEPMEEEEQQEEDRFAEALAALPTIAEREARGLARRPASRSGDGGLFEFQNDLYYAKRDGTFAARLTSTPEVEELASFSPDGRFVAFVRDFDLYVVDVETRTERALTTGGSDTLRNGKNDWVYFEEVFGRSWRAYWWSPDSSLIAFLQTDSSEVFDFTITDDRRNEADGRQRVEVSRYPRTGEPNPTVRLGIVTVGGGGPVWADTSAYEPRDMLVTGVGFWPDSSRVYCYVQNRIQSRLDFATVDPASGELRVLWREEPDKAVAGPMGAWVEQPMAPWFLEDGTFLTTSERTGWRRLEHRDRDGKLLATLTGDGWEVRGVERVDEEAGWVYVTGTFEGSTVSDLCRVSLRAEEPVVELLTPGPGTHSASVNPGGTLVIDTWSTPETPTRVAVRDIGRGGEIVRMIDINPDYSTDGWMLGEYTRHQIPARDGFVLEASVLKPPDFDPTQKYPVWFQTYGGPHAPTIWDRYGVSMQDEMLAERGIVVFRADPRPASGKGAVSAWTGYRQLGVQEARDIEDCIRWLTAHEWIDGSRVGMSGHSYGGYMTAYAMTHTKVFSAGIAGAPVTDWREYDTIYTERYMSTPQDNPEGYKVSSAVEAAGDLHGRILIVHGALDDNVHLANTIKFVDALQRANKQFELMIYPPYRHGIGGEHYNRLRYEFICRTMGVDPDADHSEGAPSSPGLEGRSGDAD